MLVTGVVGGNTNHLAFSFHGMLSTTCPVAGAACLSAPVLLCVLARRTTQWVGAYRFAWWPPSPHKGIQEGPTTRRAVLRGYMRQNPGQPQQGAMHSNC